MVPFEKEFGLSFQLRGSENRKCIREKNPPAFGMKLVAPAEDAAQRELQVESYSIESSFAQLIWDFRMKGGKLVVALNRSGKTGK